MNVVGILSVAGILFSIASTLSLWFDVNEIQNKGTTGQKSSAPFVSMLLNAFLGAYFGYFIADSTIWIVNSLNFIIMIYFCLKFYQFAVDKAKLKRSLVVGFCLSFFGLFIVVLIPKDFQLFYLGIITNIFTVISFTSPLASLKAVWKSGDASLMSFPLAVLNSGNCIVWTLYGIFTVNVYVSVPNLIGLIMSLLQINLFVAFDRTKAQELEKFI